MPALPKKRGNTPKGSKSTSSSDEDEKEVEKAKKKEKSKWMEKMKNLQERYDTDSAEAASAIQADQAMMMEMANARRAALVISR